MTEKIIEAVRELLGNDYLTTVLISMIPIVELRGAIPAAITMGLKPLVAFALAWAGSALVSPILLLILRPVLNWMKKYKIFASLAQAVEDGFKGKAMKVIGKEANSQLTGEELKKLERKKMLGVYLFVAFPIPLTGVWTGSAIATFIDIPFWKAMLMVWLGNLTAGAIVTLLMSFLSMSVVNIVLDIFFIIVILVLLLFIVRTVIKMVKNKKQAQLERDASTDSHGETTQDSTLQDTTSQETQSVNNTDNIDNKVDETQQSADNAEKTCVTRTSTNTKSENHEEEK
ncbi:MAG: small multi-drug export protein [Clostridia bacterium]|nr:small multi-drug export protein [Clostridia bacterium]